MYEVTAHLSGSQRPSPIPAIITKIIINERKSEVGWGAHFLNASFRNAECDCGHAYRGAMGFFVYDVGTVAENVDFEITCFLAEDTGRNRNLQV